MNVEIKQVRLADVKQFIIKEHYSKKCAPASYVFAMFESGVLVGAVTFGQSASPFVAISIRGRKNAVKVLELNRLAINFKKDRNAASRLIGYALRHLPEDILIVSYADTAQNHTGYVYQATNFYYAGISKSRTDIFSPSGHARHHGRDRTKRQLRSAKHRYWTATGKNALKVSLWPRLPYPKNGVEK